MGDGKPADKWACCRDFILEIQWTREQEDGNSKTGTGYTARDKQQAAGSDIHILGDYLYPSVAQGLMGLNWR